MDFQDFHFLAFCAVFTITEIKTQVLNIITLVLVNDNVHDPGDTV